MAKSKQEYGIFAMESLPDEVVLIEDNDAFCLLPKFDMSHDAVMPAVGYKR